MSVDDVVDNFICVIETAGLSLAIKASIKTWAKGTSKSMLDLVFTSP